MTRLEEAQREVKAELEKTGVELQEDEYEATPRKVSPTLSRLISFVAIFFSLFQLYTATFGNFPDLVQRGIHLMFAFGLAFALYPPLRKHPKRDKIFKLDVILIILTIFACGYVAYNYLWISENPGDSKGFDLWLGAIMIILVLEGGRRILGPALPIIGILAIMYAYFGPYLPGMWQHRGFSLRSIVEVLYLGPIGIWGLTVGLSATMIAGFLIFGTMLQELGGGETFVDLALLIAGRSPGGPAKVSVFSSAFFGTISGSAVANVVVDGVFNIPLMKKVGYRPEMAAAVEATTSSGGQIMPPVMGAGAFLMSELIGVPYIKIALAAAFPALLYYGCCWFGIHFEARRLKIKAVPPELIPKFRPLIPRLPHLILPAGIMVYMLSMGYSPSYSALLAIFSTFFLYMIGARSGTDVKEKLKKVVVALDVGGRSIVMVAVLCACAQIVIGLFNATGFGIKVSELIIGLSHGNVLFSLFFAMIVCLLLGMGIPTTAAYVLAASVVAPSLIALNVPPLTAHLFIFYFAIISAITPPVCAAVYVAAALARSNWWKTGWIACRLGLAGFIVPYMFYFAPSILLKDTVANIIINGVSASLGIISLAAGVMGYFFRKNSVFDTIALLAASALLIKPGIYTDIAGYVLVAIIIGKQQLQNRKLLRTKPAEAGVIGR